MNRVVLRSKVSNDGVLHLDVPLGEEQAEKEVQVTVEEIPEAPMSADEWRQVIMSTAGKWQGEFERPDQGEYEKREPLA